MSKATARAGSNIAFIKYWGVADPVLNLPQSSSISMTLDAAYTVTTVQAQLAKTPADDEYIIDGRPIQPANAQRLRTHLDLIRAVAGTAAGVRMISKNNFPQAAGIASSASGFAALTVAACKAFGLELSPKELSRLARRGSGSASRSIFGGFVAWDRGHSDETSVARQLYPAAHWSLYDIVAIVSHTEKRISSAQGHRLATSSPLNAGRIANVEHIVPAVEEALARRDLAALGPLIEQDALAMHAVMMTSTPSLLYWLPGTLQIIHALQQWRQEGLEAYFTIDAGPNVHVICEAAHVDAVTARLHSLPMVEQTIRSGPGEGAYIQEEHLC